MVTFNHPVLLCIAIVLTLGFFIATLLWQRFQNRSIARYGDWEVLRRFSRFSAKTAASLIFSLAIGSLAVAASEPMLSSGQNGNSPTINAVFVIDISRSMLTPDGPDKTLRLEMAARAVEAILSAYPDGRFGLVMYTNYMAAYAPTFDHDAVRIILRNIIDHYNDQVRGEGSDPITALDAAGQMLAETSYQIPVAFLLSDGGVSQATQSRPSESSVLDKLRNLGVRIVSVGIGGYVPAPIPEFNAKGEFLGFHQFQGSTAYTSLDETVLRRFADETGGWYLHLTSTQDLLELIRANHLDSQPTVQNVDVSLIWVPIVVAFFLVALLFLRGVLPGIVFRPRIS